MDPKTPESEQDNPSAPGANRFLPIAVASVCLVAGIAVGVMMNRPDASAEADQRLAAVQDQLQNTLILPNDFKSVPTFSLLDVNGDAITEDVFDGEWSIAFFGFTHCPDVCPITLSVVKDALAKLETESVPLPQTMFVSVDPNRDTPEILKKYLGFFDESFIGITGELNAILQFTKSLGIVTAFTANEDDPSSYDVDHTASMLLIDPEGRLRAKFSAPHTSDTIVSDYTTILNALTGPQT